MSAPQIIPFTFDEKFIYTQHTKYDTPIVIKINEKTGQCVARPLEKFPVLNHFGIYLGEGLINGILNEFTVSIYRNVSRSSHTNYRIETIEEFSSGLTPKLLGSSRHEFQHITHTLEDIKSMIDKNKRYLIFDNNCTSMLHATFPSPINMIYNHIDLIYLASIGLLFCILIVFIGRRVCS